MFRCPTWILASLFVVACEGTERYSLEITAQTNRREPVASATVKINGRPAGTTGTGGKLAVALDLPAGQPVRIEVYKEGAERYYAPYFKRVDVGEPGQTIEVAALLYSVPKRDGGEGFDDPAPEPSSVATAKASAEPVASTAPPEAPKLKPPVGAPEATAETKVKTPEPVAAAPVAVSTPPVKELPAKPSPPPVREVVYTVNVVDGSTGEPLAGVEVSAAASQAKRLGALCTTNPRGRCVARFPRRPASPIQFVFKKSGFHTRTQTTRVVHKAALRTALKPGYSFDIFAMTKRYGRSEGLRNVEVSVDGRVVGQTDRFGHYSHRYGGQLEDLIEVGLKGKKGVPEVFRSDFVVSKEMRLVKLFAPQEPPPFALAVGLVEGEAEAGAVAHLERSLGKVPRIELLRREKLVRQLEREGQTVAEIVAKGWDAGRLGLDGLILVTPKGENSSEFSVIDASGQAIASFRGPNRDGVLLERRLAAQLPFEGSVLSQIDGSFTINLGSRSGAGVQVGTAVEVLGMQASADGRVQEFKRVALGKVRKVGPHTSVCTIVRRSERSFMSRGDIVVLGRRQPVRRSATTQLLVTADGERGVPLAGVNVYSGQRWLGSTGGNGRLEIPRDRAIELSKHGYQSRQHAASGKAHLQIRLARKLAFLTVHSRPSQAMVLIDGKEVGTTPVDKAVSLTSGFVDLEVRGPSGFKAFRRTLELEAGTMNLVGPRTIELEVDFLARAQRQSESGQKEAALATLRDVPKGHSDYLHARHQLGTMLLSQGQRPAEALAEFRLVLADEAVRSFQDKRFLGAHVNGGVAALRAADAAIGRGDEEEAATYLQEAIDALTAVRPYLRFVPKKNWANATGSSHYYTALALQKLWQLKKERRFLEQAVDAWQQYLESDLVTKTQEFATNAEVYYKQARHWLAEETRRL